MRCSSNGSGPAVDVPEKGRENVLLVQAVLAAYRLPLFLALTEHSGGALTVLFGDRLPGGQLDSVDPAPQMNCVRLTNHFWGDGRAMIYWQEGLLAAILRRPRGVICEFNIRNLSGILGFCLAKTRSIPFIWWGHGYGKRSCRMVRRFRTWLARHADAVILYDPLTKVELCANGVPEEKVFVAENSLDTELIRQLARDENYSSRKAFLCIGRLLPDKCLDLLVNAVGSIKEILRSLECRVVVVGDGPERERIQSLVAACDLSDLVELKGAIYSEPELAAIFNASLAVVCPGTVGLVAEHALAYGIPVVAPARDNHGPESRVLVGGDNCIWFRSGDVEDLAERIAALATSQDTWERFRMGIKRSRTGERGVRNMVNAFTKAIAFAQNSVEGTKGC